MAAELAVCAGAPGCGGGGWGFPGLPLILSKVNWLLGDFQVPSGMSLGCDLHAGWSDMIQHERFLLLAIWSLQFC